MNNYGSCDFYLYYLSLSFSGGSESICSHPFLASDDKKALVRSYDLLSDFDTANYSVSLFCFGVVKENWNSCDVLSDFRFVCEVI